MLKEHYLGKDIDFFKILQNNKDDLNKSINNIQISLLNDINKFYNNNIQLFNNICHNINASLKDYNHLQINNFNIIHKNQNELIKSNISELDKIRNSIDNKMNTIIDNHLSHSFKLVNNQLQSIQKGLGEMNAIASSIGDFNKVLNNVKIRGVIGEIQLKNILEQIMTLDQYEANVCTKKNSNNYVEFAIKLPGYENNNENIYMPIDAKFPQEYYINLQNAYESGDIHKIKTLKKSLSNAIKKFGKDIHDKYLDPPYTTDFAIMFLPFENLFSEVLKNPNIIEILQRDYKIIISGPTTLAAILNSLQIGFKTLKIQKRSSKIWNVLKSVKYEFEKFNYILEKAQKKIVEANSDLDKLITTRTNAIIRNLNNIQDLPLNKDNYNEN